jgi:hypothetical protein
MAPTCARIIAPGAAMRSGSNPATMPIITGNIRSADDFSIVIPGLEAAMTAS